MAKYAENSSSAPWIIGIVLVIALGFFLMRSPADFEPAPLVRPNIEGEYIRGNANAAVVLEEYSDFQCSACAAFEPIVKEIEQEFGSELAIVYRHLPLKSIHQFAEQSAILSEAAGIQGNFWEMHDKLFEKQAEWSTESDPTNTFEKYAEELGLDLSKLRNDITAAEIIAKVNRDIAEANKKNLQATPTFVINGEVIKSLKSVEMLKEAIRTAIEKAKTDNIDGGEKKNG